MIPTKELVTISLNFISSSQIKSKMCIIKVEKNVFSYKQVNVIASLNIPKIGKGKST